MKHTVIIDESRLNELIETEKLNEELDKKDVVDMFKNDKELEKRIKNVTADVIGKLWKTLFQRGTFIDSEIRN